MVRGFRDFVLRGNVVDLAVAVVIGAAFGAVVTAFVNSLINPLIAAIVGKPDYSQVGAFTVNHATFSPGTVLGALITFIAVAAVVYFVVVSPMNAIAARRAKPAVDVSTRECPECLSSLPKAARRCSFCTSEVGAAVGV